MKEFNNFTGIKKCNIKKLFVFISVILLLSFNFYGAGFNSNGNVVVIPTVEHLEDNSQSWIGDVAAERIESNLSKYTNFVFVNRANKFLITELQKESETAMYDEKTAIEIGKMTNANYGIFIDIKYTGNKYSVGARFTNLTNGENLATVAPIFKKSIDDIASYNGCAADEITVSLCDALNVRLTSTQKYIIMNGDVGLNKSEQTKMYRENEEMYSQRINELNKEINIASQSTDAGAEGIQKNLEAELNFAKTKLNWVRDKLAISMNEEQRRQENEILLKERTDAQIERINDTSIKLANKMEDIRSEYKGSGSILSQINYVETIKKSYADINDSINSEAERVTNEAEEAISIRTEEILNEAPRMSELSNGVLTDEAIRNRQSKIDDFAFSKRIEVEAYIEILKESVASEKKNFIKDIEKEYKKFGKRTISTLSDELVVYFGDYDGNTKGWDLTIIIQSDDDVIFKTESFLPYEKLTGKKPVTDSRNSGYDEYNDDVEYYTTMFVRGEPLVIFALDVIVNPLDKDHPSEYEFTFEKFRFYDTLKTRVNSHGITSFAKDFLELTDNYTVKQMVPAYDIHTDEEIEEQEKIAEEMAEEERLEKIRIAEQQRKENEKEEKKRARAEKKNFKRSLIGINAGTMFTGGEGLSVGLEFSKGLLPFVYFNYKIDLFNYNQFTSSYYPTFEPDYNPVLGNMFQLGFNLPLGSVLEVYCAAGAGFNWCVPMEIIKANMSFDEKASAIGTESYFDLTYGFTAGASFELIPHFAITGSYSLSIVHNKDYKFDNLNFGLAFVF